MTFKYIVTQEFVWLMVVIINQLKSYLFTLTKSLAVFEHEILWFGPNLAPCNNDGLNFGFYLFAEIFNGFDNLLSLARGIFFFLLFKEGSQG